ncbi:MAG: hypothetical protein AAF141_00835 [Pseudomonadota bacterium]
MSNQQLQEHWVMLRDQMIHEHHNVAQGRMMSADALTYAGKVFAFFSQKGGRVGLGCRVGREADLAHLQLRDWQHLAPFKTKPPMKDWIVLGAGDLPHWSELARHCLNTARQKQTKQKQD